MRRSPFRRIVVYVGSLLIAVGFACGTGAEQKASATGAVMSIPVNCDISITADKSTVKVVPMVAICQAGGMAIWTITKQTGYSIEIEFALANSVKGPFPRNAKAPENPAQGRYNDKGVSSGKISTQPSKQSADTFWKYSVTLRDPSDNDVTVLDPIVIFK